MAKKRTQVVNSGFREVPIVRLTIDLWCAHWLDRSGRHVRVFGSSKEEVWNQIQDYLKA